MNSDPYDSAAWKSFGMLDADENAIFDEAMRHDPALRGHAREMDRLSAAIAAAMAPPIDPAPDQIDHLMGRLGLVPSSLASRWLAISGWTAAAVLGLLLILERTAWKPVNPESQAPGSSLRPDPSTKSAAKAETKRLVQEIEVLRENLEKFQHRDRALFQEIPGMAIPVVMTLTAPEPAADDSPALLRDGAPSPITSMLADAIRTSTSDAGEPQETPETEATELPEEEFAPPPEPPTAIPIYDAARDSGTLVVKHLPAPGEGEVYNLWVITESGEGPVYVGCLPESSASGADTFDFSLGSNMVLPSGFVLTRDPADAPARPTPVNIVLQGPPAPSR
jgi:hypothetical protein